jgi:hypothetical protein
MFPGDDDIESKFYSSRKEAIEDMIAKHINGRAFRKDGEICYSEVHLSNK